jgi:predicted ATPase
VKSLAFGSYVLRTDPRRLLHAGDEVEIGARPLALLHVFLEHPEQTLSKERLIELAWPGAPVSDNLLHVYVNKLRNTIGREWILTVGTEGYRFGGRVRRLGRAASRDLLAAIEPAPLAGRDAEAAELAHALDAHSLVTVVGPGGVGKSALARTVVGAAQADYDDGVLWVDLTHQIDAMQLAGAVAAAAGMSFDAPDAGLGLLAELSARQALLVLDNAEHLVGEVADLCTRLRLKRGGLSVLVTSQVPLLIAGEWVVRLGGLAVPPPDSESQTIAAAPSVQLFCERVRQAQRGFALGPDNAAAIAEICRLCDGVPMALELVAAQAAVLGGAPDEIEAGLLAAGRARRRDLPDRQRSVRAALDWSLQLLAPEERELLAALAVFDGGFTLDAAAALLGRPREEMVERLADLVRRSLVITQGEPPRFHLLHLVRRQLLERLEADGRAADLRRRHADWALKLARQLHDRLNADPGHLDEAIVEAANLRAAHKWAAGPGALASHALTFAAELFPYWDATARYSQARRCAAMALALPESHTPGLARKRMFALRTAAVAAVYQGDEAEAAARFREMREVALRLGDETRLAWTDHGLAACDIVAGRSEQGVAGARAAFERLEALGDRNGMVAASVYLVQGLIDLDRLDEARAAAERALAIARDGASLARAGYAHGALGYALEAQGELEAAQAHMEAALQLAQRLRIVRGQARAEAGLGHVLADRGEIAAAAQHVQRALAIMVECELDELLRDALIGAAVVLLRGGQAATAVRVAGAAERASSGGGRIAPHDRRSLQAVLAEGARALDRGAYELACTEGRALSLRQAALVSLDALKRGAPPVEEGGAAVPALRAVAVKARRSA